MEIVFGTAVGLIVVIGVAVVLFEFRVHQPDVLVLHESKGRIGVRKGLLYPRHFSLPLKRTTCPLQVTTEASAAGNIGVRVKLIGSIAPSLDHLQARGAYIDINTAASIGDLERVTELLDQDPSLANRVSEYVTYYVGSGAPLRNAAARGHIEIVKLLLERGADPNLPEEGIAPHGHALYSAVYNGHYEIAKLLLERGAYPNPPVESSADALSIALMNKLNAISGRWRGP